MNRNIRKLYELAGRGKRNIIGLMSGTSLDGLDIAYCAFTGSGQSTQVALRNFITIPYPAELKEEIRKVFAKKTGDIEHLTLLNASLGILHGQWIRDAWLTGTFRRKKLIWWLHMGKPSIMLLK